MWRRGKEEKLASSWDHFFSTNCLLLLIWQIRNTLFPHSISDLHVAMFWKRKKSPVCFCTQASWTLVPWVWSWVWKPSKRQKIGRFLIIDSLLALRGEKAFCLGLGRVLSLAPQPVTQSSRNLTDRGCLSGERCELARLSLPSHAGTFCPLPGMLVSN